MEAAESSVDGFYLVVVPMDVPGLPGAVRVAINFTHPAKRLLFSGCLVAVWALTLIQPTTAAPVYNIQRLGREDLEHTRNDGYQSSYAHGINDAGQVTWYSDRFNGGSINLGHSAWFYDGTNTIELGLTDSEHTSINGSRDSHPFGGR